MKEKEHTNNIGKDGNREFDILNKKRKPNNTLNDNNQNPMKKRFILYKPIINKQYIINKNINENLINNLNLINKEIEKNQNISSLKKEPKNLNKIIDSLINEKNNFTNNNKFINNNNLNNNENKINTIKDNDKPENQNEENKNKKAFGNYIWNIENKIGSGSFGEIIYGKHKTEDFEVAVKIINSNTSQETIKREIKISKILQNLTGFPKIYDDFIYEKKNIIIESLLGPSLDKLFRYCDKKFPLKTVCLIGKEMVKRLESMHEKGLLHRDLKPNNLAWGNFNSSYNNISDDLKSINKNKIDINTIFLIDFGLSCSYYEHDYTTKHYKMKENLNFIGTLRYASLNSHKGIRQGRRDDLESMLYILIYFLKGKLPWQDIKAKKKEERHKIIFKIKSNITIDELCQDLPAEFQELLKYVKSLQFEEKPYYGKFYAYFHNLISKLKSEEIPETNFKYIWEKKLVDNMNKYEENKDENLCLDAEKIIFKGYPINLKNFTKYIIYNNNSNNK